MNCKFTNVLMFAVGAAVGSAVTWKILDTRLKAKYERIVQEEIESIREAFSDEQPTDEDEDPDGEYKQINWEDLEDLKEELEDESDEPDQSEITRYRQLADNYTSEKGGAEEMTEKPYVIAPYDFGELDGYSQVELTYYADGVLEDEDYNIVAEADIDEIIGSDSLNTFGEYEDDAVFVRNERLRADFQILKDYRTYGEARSAGPNRVDNE